MWWNLAGTVWRQYAFVDALVQAPACVGAVVLNDRCVGGDLVVPLAYRGDIWEMANEIVDGVIFAELRKCGGVELWPTCFWGFLDVRRAYSKKTGEEVIKIADCSDTGITRVGGLGLSFLGCMVADS